jgi:hypothetical protein
MEWHIRKVDEELGKRVRLAALDRGMSVQGFIVEVLTAACGTVQMEAPAPSRVEPRVVRSVALKPRSEGVSTMVARMIEQPCTCDGILPRPDCPAHAGQSTRTQR